MDINNLIDMANRIGQYFESLPSRSEAIEGVTNHIQKFWEPRMRTALLQFLSKQPDGQSDDVSLHPLVLEAINTHRARLTPAPRIG